MSTIRPRTPDEYDAWLTEVCPVPVSIYKTLKGLIYSLLAAGIGYVAIQTGADPTVIAPIVLGSVMVYFVGEVREVELWNATIRFSRRKQHSETDED